MNPMDPVTAVSATRPFDLVTMGRIGVDLYPLQSHRVLAEVDSFSRSLGGSPTNVAVAAARLGLRSAVVTKVGNDAFGEFEMLEPEIGPDLNDAVTYAAMGTDYRLRQVTRIDIGADGRLHLVVPPE